MARTITAEQMRGLEQAAIASGAVTGQELMERAGEGVLEAVFEEWPELSEGYPKAVVLCGPGNNGGDGFVVARLLKNRGWEVEVFLFGDVERLPPDARMNYDRWAAQGKIENLTFPHVTETEGEGFGNRCYFPEYPERPADLVVDAVFGIGLTRPMTGLFHALASSDVELAVSPKLTSARHVSVDLPSGLSADTPTQPGFREAFIAELTVTFHARKAAHLDPATRPYCGKVVVKDIGL